MVEAKKSSNMSVNVVGLRWSKTTQWGKVLLENVTVAHLVEVFFAFYGNRRFITVFSRARPWSLSWV